MSRQMGFCRNMGSCRGGGGGGVGCQRGYYCGARNIGPGCHHHHHHPYHHGCWNGGGCHEHHGFWDADYSTNCRGAGQRCNQPGVGWRYADRFRDDTTASEGSLDRSSHMETIHKLVDNRQDIKRTVTRTDEGVQTHTYSKSNDPQVNSWIKQHAEQMTDWMRNGGYIRRWDPLFNAMSENYQDLHAVVDSNDDNGVRATITGDTPCAKRLALFHADVVTDFIRNGRYELRRPHEVPEECN